MRDFTRPDLLFSLCGLNCGLCPMHLDGHCPGCGGGEGNQSCKIARCSLQHGKPEYCSRCQEFPCEKYGHIDAFDSFVTHQNQKKDLEKQQEIGAEAYRAEQEEKIRILAFLLENYNDGRKKKFFCVAVNLLELEDLKSVMQEKEAEKELCSLSIKERAAYMKKRLENIADERQMVLKLRKKR
ncbi:DUF3795 domain-containing protein [Clostridiaceae bacterium]|nr:DUF3795 domain-containing protein [Clostridiaceae bacterium]RKI13875.1 DUF3795 domain-containing protein [bacterium 1XD21-70]